VLLPQALAERQQMESLLEQGNNLLQLQATSVEEIGRAGQEAKALVEQLPAVTQVSSYGVLGHSQ
jgi:hypothetical protein